MQASEIPKLALISESLRGFVRFLLMYVIIFSSVAGRQHDDFSETLLRISSILKSSVSNSNLSVYVRWERYSIQLLTLAYSLLNAVLSLDFKLKNIRS